MKLYKCLWQTIDLDHVLAVSDYSDQIQMPSFTVTLALRDVPLAFSPYDTRAADLLSEKNVIQAREKLVKAWAQRGAERDAKKA